MPMICRPLTLAALAVVGLMITHMPEEAAERRRRQIRAFRYRAERRRLRSTLAILKKATSQRVKTEANLRKSDALIEQAKALVAHLAQRGKDQGSNDR